MVHARKNRDPLVKLQIEIDNFLRNAHGEGKARGGSEQMQVPYVDVYESGDYLRIDVDLPGVKKEDVVCHVMRDLVVVEARKRPSAPEKSAHYFCMERFFGIYRREIEIPITVNTGDIEARYVEGMLRIQLPKIPDRRLKKRRVEIK